MSGETSIKGVPAILKAKAKQKGLVERVQEKAIQKNLTEAGTLTYDNNSGLFSSGVVDFVHDAFQPQILANKIMNVLEVDEKIINDLTIPYSWSVGLKTTEGSTTNITDITQANPGVVTLSADPGLSNGDIVEINNVSGMTEVNGNSYKIANNTFGGANTFELTTPGDGDNVDTSGYTAYSSGGTINVSQGIGPMNSVEVTDAGSINYISSDISSVTVGDAMRYKGSDAPDTDITIKAYAVPNLVTREISDAAYVDLISHQFKLMGYAHARKADQLVMTALKNASPSAGTYSNYAALGASTNITWNDIYDKQEIMLDKNLGSPLVVVACPKNYRYLLETAKNVVSYPPEKRWSYPRIFVGDMRLYVSTQVQDNTTYLISPKDTGYLVTGKTNMRQNETPSGYIGTEIISYIKMGAGIVIPESIYRIKDNTA